MGGAQNNDVESDDNYVGKIYNVSFSALLRKNRSVYNKFIRLYTHIYPSLAIYLPFIGKKHVASQTTVNESEKDRKYTCLSAFTT